MTYSCLVGQEIKFYIFLRYDHVKNIVPEERCFCQKCGELLPTTQKDLHADHSEFLEENINDLKLSHPSQVIMILLLFYIGTVLCYANIPYKCNPIVKF